MNMTLKKYTKDRGINIRRLSEITGVSYPQLYRISKDKNYNATVKTMMKIAAGTHKEFGEPLLPIQYLNVGAILGEG